MIIINNLMFHNGVSKVNPANTTCRTSLHQLHQCVRILNLLNKIHVRLSHIRRKNELIFFSVHPLNTCDANRTH